MLHRLKATSPAFRMTDGQFSGRKFTHGTVYDEIPPGYEARFDSVDDPLSADDIGNITNTDSARQAPKEDLNE